MDWTALIAAITALVVAIGGVIGVVKHVNAPDPHPKAEV